MSHHKYILFFLLLATLVQSFILEMTEGNRRCYFTEVSADKVNQKKYRLLMFDLDSQEEKEITANIN